MNGKSQTYWPRCPVLLTPAFQTLIELGMENSFQREAADFSGINGHRGLSVSTFQQLTNFRLVGETANEETPESAGTEAGDPGRFTMSFERQFLFVVRHKSTGLLTTIGRYYKPPDPGQEDPDHHHHEHHHHEDDDDDEDLSE